MSNPFQEEPIMSNPEGAGLISHPAATANGACCSGAPAPVQTLTEATTGPCCGTSAEATTEGSCCGTHAKAEAVASGQSCCG
jgi:hypothetical protein